MISPQAIIDPSAKIGKRVQIGPFSVIGAQTVIGDDTWIGPHVVLRGPTVIGKENKIFQFASIGEDCQDKKYHGENTELHIGDRNIFREGCTVHRGTKQGGNVTIIGNDNLFMVNAHVAHDCIIGDHVVFANNATLAGHVKVDDFAILGGLVGVHQFCSIGAHSFAAGGTIIYKDVLPFTKISGYPAKTFGLNTVGLERNNFSTETIEWLNKAYKVIFRSSTTVKEALDMLEKMVASCAEIQLLCDFLQASTRGIVR
jgi:UDP-N-acetylglucosamine acyltransferase